MLGWLVSHVRFVALSLALTAVCYGQSADADVRPVMSNREARKAATTIVEPTVPPGLHPAEFSVRVAVDADGTVKSVSNPKSLPEPLFRAAAEAARKWIFAADRPKGKPHSFEADITFHGPISGTVTRKDGTPIAGVLVFGSMWTCCPAQQDTMKTDKSGKFSIEHPGEVLHFIPPEGFQPLSLVVTSEMSALKVTLDAEGSRLSLTRCSEPQRGFQRDGGRYGLEFNVSRRDAVVKHGKVDTDYVVDTVRAKHGVHRLEFWFGPYAAEGEPEDEQFIESAAFTSRNVVMTPGLVPGSDGGVFGIDTSGRLPNGEMWRQAVFGSEMARYVDATPEEAAIFDRIIDSACWIPYPEN